jgi:hypothetical protein
MRCGQRIGFRGTAFSSTGPVEFRLGDFFAYLHSLLYLVAAYNPLVRALSRLFICHSGQNDDWPLALLAWLTREGWSNDVFLDLDPERGTAAGQRWAWAFEHAAKTCEVVLFLVSESWLASKWCRDEYELANRLK